MAIILLRVVYDQVRCGSITCGTIMLWFYQLVGLEPPIRRGQIRRRHASTVWRVVPTRRLPTCACPHVVDQVVGISVDTHVHRISNQLGWAGRGGSKTPEQTRKVLEAWMPQEVWADVNLLLVGLGQEVQTEKAKLLGKCLECSDPPRALRLASSLGLHVSKELDKAKLKAPADVLDEGL